MPAVLGLAIADARFDTRCYCRIAEECKSPLEELEVALDAMCAMEHLFYYRFRILSAVDRRVGGQGVVQIASMMNTNQRVRDSSRQLLACKLLLSAVSFTEVPCSGVH